MALESLLAVFSSLLSIGGIISLLINVVLTAVVIMILDKVIAHEIEPKHSLVMAFLAYFVAPLLISVAVQFVPIIALLGVVLPLIVWMLLGQVLLKADMKQKAIVAIVAFVANMFLLSYVSGFIIGLLPF